MAVVISGNVFVNGEYVGKVDGVADSVIDVEYGRQPVYVVGEE